MTTTIESTAPVDAASPASGFEQQADVRLDGVVDRHGLAARTRRLLPDLRDLVEELGEGQARVPSLLSIVLTTRRGLARAARRSAAACAPREARAPRRRRSPYWERTWDQIARREAVTCLEPTPNAATVYVHAQRAAGYDEVEFGAMLARQLMRAALLTDPDRARHLSPEPGRRALSLCPPDELIDLQRARLDAERLAGERASEAWRSARRYAAAPLERADQVLDALESFLAPRPPQGTSAGPLSTPAAAVLARVYGVHRPDEDPETRWTSRLLIRLAGSSVALSGRIVPMDIGYERRQRLLAAAHADVLALQAQAAGRARRKLDAEADALAWHLRAFDARHGTGSSAIAAGDPVWQRGEAERHYVRCAWTSASSAAGAAGSSELMESGHRAV